MTGTTLLGENVENSSSALYSVIATPVPSRVGPASRTTEPGPVIASIWETVASVTAAVPPVTITRDGVWVCRNAAVSGARSSPVGVSRIGTPHHEPICPPVTASGQFVPVETITESSGSSSPKRSRICSATRTAVASRPAPARRTTVRPSPSIWASTEAGITAVPPSTKTSPPGLTARCSSVVTSGRSVPSASVNSSGATP